VGVYVWVGQPRNAYSVGENFAKCEKGVVIVSRIKLFPHQAKALEDTEKLNKVAYYLDMRNRLR
jgi:hypothetical protein